MHARKSRSEWLAIIGAFEQSGKSHEAFCSARGLSVGSFRAWLYRLRAARATATEITLVPVEMTRAVATPSDLVVTVAGVEVRVAIGADVSYVAGLIAELRERC
jgi:hypothetical protein